MNESNLQYENRTVNRHYQIVANDFSHDMLKLAAAWMRIHQPECALHNCEYEVTSWLSLVCPECEQMKSHQPLPF